MDAIDLTRMPHWEQLRLRRLALHITQAELAERLGTWTPQICAAERGAGGRRSGSLSALRARMDAALAELEAAARG